MTRQKPRNSKTFDRSAALCVALSLAGLSACTSGAVSDHASIWVSAPTALADQPVALRVTGLASGQQVTIAARATDAAGRTWRSAATFSADPDGVVNLASAAPESGSYRGADGMGIFWSMDTTAGEYGNEYFTPVQPQSRAGYLVRLTVTSFGHQLAARTIVRN